MLYIYIHTNLSLSLSSLLSPVANSIKVETVSLHERSSGKFITSSLHRGGDGKVCKSSEGEKANYPNLSRL